METEVLRKCNVCGSEAISMVDKDCNIVRCRHCGYVFDNPRPSKEELVRFYSRPTQYDSWLSHLDARKLLWERRLHRLQSTRKSGSVLDVGTGIGQFLALATPYYADVYGTEVSSTAVRIAKEKFGLDVFHGTIEGLAASGRVFDNITLFHVLEHVPDPRSLLKTCHSLLSPHGVLVIAVPNEITSLRARAKRTLTRIGVKRSRKLGQFGLPLIRLEADTDEVHLSHFTPKVLLQLLQATGFSVLKSTLDPYYIAHGFSKFKADLYYYSCLGFLRVFRLNIYDTMLMISRKVIPDSVAV